MPEKPYEPIPDDEYKQRLSALPAEAQWEHRNMMELMAAAQTGDRAKIKALLQRFRAERMASGDTED